MLVSELMWDANIVIVPKGPKRNQTLLKQKDSFCGIFDDKLGQVSFLPSFVHTHLQRPRRQL